MGGADLMLMLAILAAALWLLYRSLWKSRGRCPGCSGNDCSGTHR